MRIVTRACSVDGCDRTGKIVRGMCGAHYQRVWSRGLPPRPSAPERLAAGLVRMPNGCLEWTRALTKDYGQFWANDKMTYTHRFAWELAHGPIPPGLSVLHHCDNPPCGETEPSERYPDGHLFLGTQTDNMADASAKGRLRNHREGVLHASHR